MTEEIIEISVKGKWLSVPALIVAGQHIISRGNWLKTAVVEAEEWLATPVSAPEECVQVLKTNRSGKVQADIFAFREKLPATEPKYQYYHEWESVAAIRLTTFDEWWNNLPQESRKNVRRAQKRGVVVRVQQLDEKLIDDIIALNNDSPIRQGKAYSHFGKTREQVARDQKDFLDRSDYVCAYHESELIGLVKLIHRDDIASILTFLPKASQSDKRPANALMAKVVEICTKKNLKYVIFGLFNYHNKRDTSLREFKTRNGFKEILVPRYFVPLTLKGAVSIKLNLHQGLIGFLPNSVMTLLVKVRARLKLASNSRCSSTTEQSNCNRQMGRLNPPAGSNL